MLDRQSERNRLTKLLHKANQQKPAWYFRLTAFILIGAYVVFAGIAIWHSDTWTRARTDDSSIMVADDLEYKSVYLSFVLHILPTTPIFCAWFSFGTWKVMQSDKTHIWQGSTTVILAGIATVYGICSLYQILFIEEYVIHDPLEEAPIPDCSVSLSSQISTHYMYLSGWWTAIMFSSLFNLPEITDEQMVDDIRDNVPEIPPPAKL